MAFSAVFEVADEEMISVFLFKRYFVNEPAKDGLDAFRIMAAPDHEFQVFFKALCIDGRPH
jgi:hypothetical protein